MRLRSNWGSNDSAVTKSHQKKKGARKNPSREIPARNCGATPVRVLETASTPYRIQAFTYDHFPISHCAYKFGLLQEKSYDAYHVVIGFAEYVRPCNAKVGERLVGLVEVDARQCAGSNGWIFDGL